MSNDAKPSSPELTPQERDEILRRILGSVEKDQRKRWVEIVCAIVLSLATMASAWCAYQATLWGGVQTFRLAKANKAGRDSTQQTIAMMQFRSFDASMFITYIEARSRNDEKVEKFLYHRFRPEMRKAVDAWLKTDPENDPNAPKSPFKMQEYAQEEEQDAKRHDAKAAEMMSAAQEANETSDRYVLLTVLFATVLFLGGIGGTLDSDWLRRALNILALALFIVMVVVLATMPLCTE
jgi:hypothetical protein